MVDPKTSVDVWDAIFNQTPTIIRFALGVLSFGIFTLAGVLYKMNQKAMDETRTQQSADTRQVNMRIDRLETKLDASTAEMNRHLLEIAQNTRRDQKRKDDP